MRSLQPTRRSFVCLIVHYNCIGFNCLGDDGLDELVDALPQNTHLRVLHLDGNDLSTEFARNWLMPALVANTSLQEISSGHTEADAFVAARTAAVAAIVVHA